MDVADIKETLTKKVGPLPVYMWAALGSVAILGFILWRRSQSNAAAASGTNTAATGVIVKRSLPGRDSRYSPLISPRGRGSSLPHQPHHLRYRDITPALILIRAGRDRTVPRPQHPGFTPPLTWGALSAAVPKPDKLSSARILPVKW